MMTKTKPKSNILPIAAGILVLVVLVGFTLGLRTVILFDPASAQVKTTKYLFLHLPISSETRPTWISPGLPNAPDWQLMHEFHQSATGTKLVHTHWGAIVDTFEPWSELRFNIDAMDTLSADTLALINSDTTTKAIRVYLMRVDAQLNYRLAQPDAELNPEIITTIMSEAEIEPIEREASKFADP